MRDEHCHILWGVDDGSVNREMTMRMLDAAVGCGISHVVCTPHFRWSEFSRELVEERYAEFSEAANARGVRTTLGFEVYYRTLVERGIEHAPEYTEGGGSNLLIEFNSGGEIPFDWEHTFYKLQGMGLDLTVAHPERYSTVLDDFDMVYRLRDFGCRIEVSAGDLLRGRFDACRKAAVRIVKEGLCDAIVSDAHCPEHYKDYARALKKWG